MSSIPSSSADASQASPETWPPPGESPALLAAAQGLRLAAEAGQARALLRGKNIGLLCESPDSPDAMRFQLAAAELGAKVARILPSLATLDSEEQVANTARVLGRLYDAVECQGLNPLLVQQLQRAAGVPVFAGLGSADHPSHALAEAWARAEPAAGAEACRRYLLQAALVNSII